MKEHLAFAALVVVLVSLATLQAEPVARPNADAAAFWSSAKQSVPLTASQPAPPAETAPEHAIATPARPERGRNPHSTGLLFAALIAFGVVSVRRQMPERVLATILRRHRRPTAVERLGAKVDDLRAVAATVSNAELRSHLEAICGTSDEIVGLFEQRPALVRNAGLIEFTIDNVRSIASSYRDLARTSLSAATPALARACALIASIDGTLRGQLERLLQDDLTQLMSAVELLDARLEIEAENEHG